MEFREADKLVISKPVASRPTCSKFRSFSDLLAGSISSVSPGVTTIKPRTIRFKPAGERVVFSKDHCPVDEVQCLSDMLSDPDCTDNVIYKPMARFVSKTTVTNLAKLSSINSIQDQGSEEANLEMPKLVKGTSDFGSENHQNLLSQSSNEKGVEYPDMQATNLGEEQRSVPRPTDNDNPHDGYNWRKYGQKKVKGSEYPRSYYKCTHPNCPVKKKVEQTLDGQIAEIVYKGEHNHSKQRLLKRDSFDGPKQVNAGSEWSSQLCHKNESMIEYKSYANSSSYRQGSGFHGPNTTGVSILDYSSGQSGELDDGSDCMDTVNDEPKRKARKNEHQFNDTGIAVAGTNVVVGGYQTSVYSEITRDGFRWRKYGQKFVKGNSYPRSYYKCTNQKCNVRKYVERTSEDPNAFITTYEGKHNHEVSMKTTHSATTKPSTKALNVIAQMIG